jgi:predicted 2-oxoglutarate/Fe(II)-dependent dioxygenase YbiX
MPAGSFFTRLGLFVSERFLEPDDCARILAQAQDMEWEPAPINRNSMGGVDVVDLDERKTLRARLRRTYREELHERLRALKPALEEHFSRSLSGHEAVQLLRYPEGHYFKVHRDSTSQPDGNELARRRQLSLTLFLNAQASEPAAGKYGGGELVFYGLLKDPRAQTHGFPLAPEAGLLVAFPSDVMHEVKPITWGERYSLVTWFF